MAAAKKAAKRARTQAKLDEATQKSHALAQAATSTTGVLQPLGVWCGSCHVPKGTDDHRKARCTAETACKATIAIVS